ncbi:MAG: Gfa-like protein [Parcubacteria group bacterium]|nr:Gfa-like protein [Parcubacteria group bacterium]
MKTYTGGCHCGKFKYEAEIDLKSAIECNCSRCHKLGLVLSFIPPEQFKLIEGSETELTDYQFNTMKIHHLFCPDCGVESFARGANKEGNPLYCINVRCLDDVLLSDLTITPVNGKDY